MSIYLKQHKLLSILSANHLDWHTTDGKTDFAIEYESLYKMMGCNQKEFMLYAARLFDDEEIGHYEIKFKGAYLTPKGLTSLAQKKYIKENNDFKIGRIKSYLGITVSIIAVITAIIGVVSTITSVGINSKEIQKLTQRVNTLEHKK